MVAPAEPRVAAEMPLPAETVYAAEALALQKLVKLLDSEHQDVVLKAAEVISKYAAERRRNETRLAVEKMRAETALAKVAAARAARGQEEDADPYARLGPAAKKELETEWADTLGAWNPTTLRPRVYLWGGEGVIGNGAVPDDRDTRVRVLRDDAPGDGDGPLFWVVPDDKLNAPGVHMETLR
jgi:hypothetical protein